MQSIKNDFRHPKSKAKNSTCLYFASDATLLRWAWVQLDDSGFEIDHNEGDFIPPIENIDEGEAFASAEALIAARKKSSVALIALANDNRPVGCSFDRAAAKADSVQEQIDRCEIDTLEQEVVIVDVDTADNIADVRTKLGEFFSEENIAHRHETAFTALKRGIDNYKKTDMTFSSRFDRVEEDDDDDLDIENQSQPQE